MTRTPTRDPAFDRVAEPVPEAGPGIDVASRTAPAGNPHELLSRRQVERTYGIPVKTLERFAWAGGGPRMVKLGHRTVRYRRGDIEAFITAHVVGGPD